MLKFSAEKFLFTASSHCWSVVESCGQHSNGTTSDPCLFKIKSTLGKYCLLIVTVLTVIIKILITM